MDVICNGSVGLVLSSCFLLTLLCHQLDQLTWIWLFLFIFLLLFFSARHIRHGVHVDPLLTRFWYVNLHLLVNCTISTTLWLFAAANLYHCVLYIRTHPARCKHLLFSFVWIRFSHQNLCHNRKTTTLVTSLVVCYALVLIANSAPLESFLSLFVQIVLWSYFQSSWVIQLRAE